MLKIWTPMQPRVMVKVGQTWQLSDPKRLLAVRVEAFLEPRHKGVKLFQNARLLPAKKSLVLDPQDKENHDLVRGRNVVNNRTLMIRRSDFRIGPDGWHLLKDVVPSGHRVYYKRG